jgi:hypothetical protein
MKKIENNIIEDGMETLTFNENVETTKPTVLQSLIKVLQNQPVDTPIETIKSICDFFFLANRNR